MPPLVPAEAPYVSTGELPSPELVRRSVASFAPGHTVEARWGFVQDSMSRFAGESLTLDADVYASAAATNHRNRALVDLLESYRLLGSDPSEAVDRYTRQSCLKVTAFDLAVMGATLANGGVNPVTKERVVDAMVCHFTLAVMATSGLYEGSGDWLYDVGVPRLGLTLFASDPAP